MSAHEWLSVLFIVAGTAGTAGSVAYMARISTTRSTKNSEDIVDLRERMVVVETILKIPRNGRG